MKMEIVFWKSLKWYIRKVISSFSHARPAKGSAQKTT